MDDRDAYEKEMEAQLKAHHAKIEALQAQAEEAEAQVKIKIYNEIEQLIEKQRVLEAHLNKLRESGDEAWKDLKGGVEDACKDLRQALDRAASRILQRD
jgi:uncharacterized protein involved in exopolysaccharide biosynthesis